MTSELVKVKPGSTADLPDLPAALGNAIALWADATTDAGSKRRRDLLRGKRRAVGAFFSFTGKHPAKVTPLDVKTWQAELEGQSLAPATVYARISRVSSFYRWAMQDPELSAEIHRNPVELARPKAPKAYQGGSVKSLTDDDARALLAAVKERADSGNVVGKRDYALLLFYMATGMRRAEVIRLQWGDLRMNGTIILDTRVKGGDYRAREVNDPRVKVALLDYLETSGRLDEMTPESPLWTSHDRANAKPGAALTSHAFAKNVKRYARLAGIGDVHLHQTRHTVARMAGDAGSMVEVQELLGHKSIATTRVYLQSIAIQKDRHSTTLLDRLGA